ncbi:MAG: hypothetical protein H6553_07070 [Chitinophagales bacterium]|nr:hypothetical protein [Chitinophagales bacterium]
MQQRLVLWGEIGTDRAALITIQLDEENAKIHLHAFPKDEAPKELQDQLFVDWKNGGDIAFPETSFYWLLDANEDNILPENIKVERPDLLIQAQNKWSRKLMSAKINQLLHHETDALQQKVEALNEYDKELWEEAKEQWNKISDYQKKGEISWEQTTVLKDKINHIFDALKAMNRLFSEKDEEQEKVIIKSVEAKLELLEKDLIYQDKWNKSFDELKKVQKEINDAPIKWKSKKTLYDVLNNLFDTLKKYRNAEYANKTKKRVKDLNRILKGIKDSMAKDKEAFDSQVEKMLHYTKGNMAKAEIEKRFSYLLDRVKDKEKKLKDIQKTIEQLQAKIDKEKEEQKAQKQAAENKTAEKAISKATPTVEENNTATTIVSNEVVTENKTEKKADTEQQSTTEEQVNQEETNVSKTVEATVEEVPNTEEVKATTEEETTINN